MICAPSPRAQDLPIANATAVREEAIGGMIAAAERWEIEGKLLDLRSSVVGKQTTRDEL